MRSAPVLGVLAALAAVATIVALVAWGPLGLTLERDVGLWQNGLAAQASSPQSVAGWRLYGLAFGGGLIASLSPCILGLLPVNLAYIGAAHVTSRVAALRVSSSFVLGVVVVNVVLGLVSSLFFALFVAYRGQVNVLVGTIAIVMALWLLGAVRIRVPQTVTRIPTGLGSFAVGIAFALVASPCASPILVVVLGAASLSPTPLSAVAAMTLYSLGYTAVLFLASLFAGLMTASRKLLSFGMLISRLAAVALFAIGVEMIVYGLRQLVA